MQLRGNLLIKRIKQINKKKTENKLSAQKLVMSLKIFLLMD